MTSLNIHDRVYIESGLKANKMYWITLLLTLSVCMHGAHSVTISIKVGDGATQTYDSGASLEVQVGTMVLLIVGIDCEWNWDILNPISQSLTTQSGWNLKYLHIVPFTRAEMGVYSCDYFSTKLNLTLVATGTNLFRSYGGTAIQGEMNNSVVLAKIHSEVDIQIHCVQSEALRETGGYWIGPDGNEVGLNGSVYVKEDTVSGESVLLVQATSGDNVTEGVYTCTTDDNASYTVLLYRDLYSVVRGSGERELLNDTVEIVFVSVGEEISLVCPRGTVADYQGENAVRIERQQQQIHIPLFTHYEAGIYKCKTDTTNNHVEFTATNSALITLPYLTVLVNDSFISVTRGVTQYSVVCAGSGNYTGWYLNGEHIPVGESELVRNASSFGGVELYLGAVTTTRQGVYVCESAVLYDTGSEGVDRLFVSVYLEELELVLVTDTGVEVAQGMVVFLKSATFREITCKSAEFFLDTVSVNWTADSGFRLDNTSSLTLSQLSDSSLYTCTAANAFSTGNVSVYILSDTRNANLSVAYSSRRVVAHGSDVILVELEVGLQNVVIACTAFQPILTLPWKEIRSAGMSTDTISYTLPLVTPEYNGVVSCTGVSHAVSRVNISTVGAVLVREWSGGYMLLDTGVTVVTGTEYYACVGSDLTEVTEWDKTGRETQLFVRLSPYREVLRFESNSTPEGFYTCLARNETGGIEKFTQGLFSSMPYGPDIDMYVNGSNTSEYVLVSSTSVSLECKYDSYPPAIAILWYTGDQLISNSTQLELNVTNGSITVSCVVSTVFRTNQRYVTLLYTGDDVIIANTTTTTTTIIIQERNTWVLVLLFLTLIVVIAVPIATSVTCVIVHRLLPADWLDRLKEREFSWRCSSDRKTTHNPEFKEYDRTKLDYKSHYKIDELEQSVDQVKFWESKQIKEEYAKLKERAFRDIEVKEDYHSPNAVRITSQVSVRNDLTTDSEQRAQTHTVIDSGTASPDTQSLKDTTPLLEETKSRKEDNIKAKNWEEEHIKRMLDIEECPGFFIVKDLAANENNLCRSNAKSCISDEEKVSYLNFLFRHKPDDVVFVTYQSENGRPEGVQFVFYPHGPKNNLVKIKCKNDDRVYLVYTKSFFSTDFYTMRQLVIREEKKKTSIEIRLFNFLIWPMVEVGTKTYPFIEFVRSFWFKKQNSVNRKSIVLHCDAGTRCATFISIYYLLSRTKQDKVFNLFEFFVKLVEKDLELFPTYTQYEFLHSMILDLTLEKSTCQSGELDSKYKRLFEFSRDYNPWREDRLEMSMGTLDDLIKEANKERQLRFLDPEKSQKKRTTRQDSEDSKEKKDTEQTSLDKEEDDYRSDDEIELVEDRGKFVSSLSGSFEPEALFVRIDTGAVRYRKDRKKKERSETITPKKDPFDKTEDSKKEYQQLRLYRPHLLKPFAHPPTYTRYRTHKKHLKKGKQEAVLEQLKREKVKGEEKSKKVDKDEAVKEQPKKNGKQDRILFTNKRALNIEEKLSMDECTRYELFQFGTGQSQVYGPNISDENQSQGFWLHSLYGEEIIATRHPIVNDFEYANYNNPQFNLHLYKQHAVTTVVALCTFEELIDAYSAKKDLRHKNRLRDGKQLMSPYWPPEGEVENFGPYKVSTKSNGHIDEKNLMQWFDLEYKDTKDMDEHSIRLFLCKDWPTLMETNHSTGRHDRFVQFMTHVVAYTKKSKSERIAVHCSDTKPYSAEFSAVFYALKQDETEGQIDMYQIVKGIQLSRRQSSCLITEDQYFLSMALTNDCLLSVAKSNEE